MSKWSEELDENWYRLLQPKNWRWNGELLEARRRWKSPLPAQALAIFLVPGCPGVVDEGDAGTRRTPLGRSRVGQIRRTERGRRMNCGGFGRIFFIYIVVAQEFMFEISRSCLLTYRPQGRATSQFFWRLLAKILRGHNSHYKLGEYLDRVVKTVWKILDLPIFGWMILLTIGCIVRKNV